MKRFLQFILENEYDVPDNEWHHVDHKNPTHSKVIEAFHNLADTQRGHPERAMINVQRTHGGGVLSVMAEHIGDLTHRMTEMTKYGNFGHEHVSDKVKKGITYLTNPYGFDREHKENVVSNAKSYNTPNNIIRRDDYRGPDYTPEKHHARVDAALTEYKKEHSKLPVYNRAQFHARGAAIALGMKEWDLAASHLYRLKDMMESKEGWDHHASKFRWGKDGHPKEYNIGDD